MQSRCTNSPCPCLDRPYQTHARTKAKRARSASRTWWVGTAEQDMVGWHGRTSAKSLKPTNVFPPIQGRVVCVRPLQVSVNVWHVGVRWRGGVGVVVCVAGLKVTSCTDHNQFAIAIANRTRFYCGFRTAGLDKVNAFKRVCSLARHTRSSGSRMACSREKSQLCQDKSGLVSKQQASVRLFLPPATPCGAVGNLCARTWAAVRTGGCADVRWIP